MNTSSINTTFSIVDVGLSDLSSDADSDGSLGPGPSRAQYCSVTYAEDSLSLTSDDDTSLSEVE